jgi:hypothetical protein
VVTVRGPGWPRHIAYKENMIWKIRYLCVKYYLENLFGMDQPLNRGLVGRTVMRTR